jgi:hypothetical protein
MVSNASTVTRGGILKTQNAKLQGALSMHVDGALNLAGSLYADGATGSADASGGAGGSIYMTTGTLTGTGRPPASQNLPRLTADLVEVLK